MKDFRDSDKYKASLATLPENLRPVYEALVAQYTASNCRILCLDCHKSTF